MVSCLSLIRIFAWYLRMMRPGPKYHLLYRKKKSKHYRRKTYGPSTKERRCYLTDECRRMAHVQRKVGTKYLITCSNKSR